jgi:hypothetical protein
MRVVKYDPGHQRNRVALCKLRQNCEDRSGDAGVFIKKTWAMMGAILWASVP